jgi:RNA polymerase sigma-70 factor (ECF subfamily)
MDQYGPNKEPIQDGRGRGRPARLKQHIAGSSEVPIKSADASSFLSKAFSPPQDPLAAQIAEYSYSVLSFCIKKLPSLHDAQEVAQEALLRALKEKSEFDGQSSISTWLLSIAKNACADFYRRHALRATVPLGEKVDSSLAANPERKSINHELKGALFKAFQCLSDQERVAVSLHYFQDFKISDISIRMHVSEATALSLLARAREKLREELFSFGF